MGKGFVGDVYNIDPYLATEGQWSGGWEFIVVHTNVAKDVYVGDTAKKIDNELHDYLLNKYQHDDIFVHVENKFNTGLVITMYY